MGILFTPKFSWNAAHLKLTSQAQGSLFAIRSTNKRSVRERDQCPRRSFGTELKECRSYSPKQITLLYTILRTNFKYENQQRTITPKV